MHAPGVVDTSTNAITGMKASTAVVVLSAFLLSCDGSSTPGWNPVNVHADYALPYPVGKAYVCMQGFNSTPTHMGSFKYSVDFSMSIGTPVTAARRGQVVYVVHAYFDSDPAAGHENVVIVRHEDSTYARYSHLTMNGSWVIVNNLVIEGDTIGLSGNSGSSVPHLHFDVTASFSGRDDQTIPFAFRNTAPHPAGPQRGVTYEAYRY